MNQKRKQRVIEVLSCASTNLTYIKEDEEEAMGNVPESLQETDRYIRMEESVDFLNDAIDTIDQLVEAAYNL